MIGRTHPSSEGVGGESISAQAIKREEMVRKLVSEPHRLIVVVEQSQKWLAIVQIWFPFNMAY